MFTIPNISKQLKENDSIVLDIFDDMTMRFVLNQENMKNGMWRNVQQLNMKNSAITIEAFSVLGKNEHSSNIEEIDASLNFTTINSSVFDEIIKSPYLVNLKVLDLSDTLVDDRGIDIFINHENSRNLVQLVLYGCYGISSDSLTEIARSDKIKCLSELVFRSTAIDDQGIIELCQNANSNRIQLLDISMNFQSITDQTLQAIATSQYMKKLKSLIISNCQITDMGIQTLCISQNSAKIQELDICNDLQVEDQNQGKMSGKDESEQKFTKRHIVKFNLNNLISDQTLRYISNSDYINYLVQLNLKGLDVTDEGLNQLFEGQNVQQLQQLRISDNDGITDNFLSQVSKNYEQNCPKLRKLWVTNTNVSEQGIKIILDTHPEIDIIYPNSIKIKEDPKLKAALQKQKDQQYQGGGGFNQFREKNYYDDDFSKKFSRK